MLSMRRRSAFSGALPLPSRHLPALAMMAETAHRMAEAVVEMSVAVSMVMEMADKGEAAEAPAPPGIPAAPVIPIAPRVGSVGVAAPIAIGIGRRRGRLLGRTVLIGR